MSIFQGGSCSSSSSVLSSPGVSADEYDEEDDAFVVDATPLKKRKTEKDPPKRTTRISAVQMLEKKYEQRAAIKEKELELRQKELELQEQKWKMEERERNQRLELDREERRVFLDILKKHVNIDTQ